MTLLFSPAAIGRTLIPRYFRSIFEGGATELFYVLKHPKESFHSNFVSLDCDQCTMVTQNGKPMFTQVQLSFSPSRWKMCSPPSTFVPISLLFVSCDKVCVEGRLYLEFMFDDMMRIKTWHFSIRQHREVLPRSILAMHVSCCWKNTHVFKSANCTCSYLSHCFNPITGSPDARPAG